MQTIPQKNKKISHNISYIFLHRLIDKYNFLKYIMYSDLQNN